ncbi:hypothetical protein D3C72_808490 [compost metagenome]
MNLSAESVSPTFIAKFFSNSFVKRSLICLEVTNLPSLPKKGESLIVNNMLIVGSSIAIVCNASGFSKSATVSPISKPSIPTIAQMSPAITSSTFLRPRPSKVCNSLILDFMILPSLFTNEIGIPSFKTPLSKRPIAIRPVKEEKSKEVISICGVPSETLGAGTFLITISNNGSMFSVWFFQSSDIQLFFAEP